MKIIIFLNTGVYARPVTRAGTVRASTSRANLRPAGTAGPATGSISWITSANALQVSFLTVRPCTLKHRVVCKNNCVRCTCVYIIITTYNTRVVFIQRHALPSLVERSSQGERGDTPIMTGCSALDRFETTCTVVVSLLWDVEI